MQVIYSPTTLLVTPCYQRFGPSFVFRSVLLQFFVAQFQQGVMLLPHLFIGSQLVLIKHATPDSNSSSAEHVCQISVSNKCPSNKSQTISRTSIIYNHAPPILQIPTVCLKVLCSDPYSSPSTCSTLVMLTVVSAFLSTKHSTQLTTQS